MLRIRDYSDPWASRAAPGGPATYDEFTGRPVSVSTAGGGSFTGILVENTRGMLTLVTHIRRGRAVKAHIVKAHITSLCKL